MRRGVIIGVWLALANVGWADEYYFNFENRQFDRMNLLYMQATDENIEFTSRGLLIKIPGGTKSQAKGFKPRFTVQGDFEIMGVFEIVKRDAAPKESYGVGASIYIATATEREDAASIAMFERYPKRNFIFAHFASTTEGKRQHQVHYHPTTHTSGVLALSRKGDKLSYYYARSPQEDYQLIQTANFVPDDLTLVRFAADAGNSTAAVQVLWKEIRIQATKLAGIYQPQIVQAPSPWIRWAIILGIAGLLIALGIAVWTYYRRYAYLP